MAALFAPLFAQSEFHKSIAVIAQLCVKTLQWLGWVRAKMFVRLCCPSGCYHCATLSFLAMPLDTPPNLAESY